jgi:hypothetical protein
MKIFIFISTLYVIVYIQGYNNFNNMVEINKELKNALIFSNE